LAAGATSAALSIIPYWKTIHDDDQDGDENQHPHLKNEDGNQNSLKTPCAALFDFRFEDEPCKRRDV
jgi:hypothetical protein